MEMAMSQMIRNSMRKYNRNKKPWRNSRLYSKAVGRKNHRFRVCLCCVAMMELLIIGVREPSLFSAAEPPLSVSRESELFLETEIPGGNDGTWPADQKESGFTIDLKKGKVEFWRKNQTIRPACKENGLPRDQEP